MPAWDYYPYDTYCQSLATAWLFSGAGPAHNLADPASTFNVKFAEGVYNAYRKGGFVMAEQFKDCVVTRYGHNVTTMVSWGPVVDASSFGAALSFKLLAPVARAKQDIEAEAARAGLRAGLQYVAREPAETVRMGMRAFWERPTVPVPMPGPLTPLPSPAEPMIPAAAQLTDVVMGKSWHGYAYRGVTPGMEAFILGELDQMSLTGDVTLDVGVTVQGKLAGWTGAGAAMIGGGNADEWVNDARAAGQGVLVGEPDELAPGTATASTGGGDAYLVATRDISVVSALCQRDPVATVIYEPRDGWLEPSAEELTRGEEAGVGLPKWALYGAAAAGVLGIGVVAYCAGRGG